VQQTFSLTQASCSCLQLTLQQPYRLTEASDFVECFSFLNLALPALQIFAMLLLRLLLLLL